MGDGTVEEHLFFRSTCIPLCFEEVGMCLAEVPVQIRSLLGHIIH